MKKIVLSMFFCVALSSHLVHAAQTIKAHVNGMVCAFCAQGIEKKMRALPQTQDVYVNLKQRIVAVEVKDGQAISQEKVKAIIKDAGYDVTNIDISSQTAAQVRTELEEKEAK